MLIGDNNLNVVGAEQVAPLNGNAPGTAPAPTVTNVSPSSGPAAGGTTVAITGTNFAGATIVMFGGVAAAGFTVNSSTSITAVSPAGTSVVDVTVTTSAGTSARSAADQFAYDTTIQPIGFNVPAQAAYVGTSVLLAASGGGSGNPVVFTVVSGPGMVSGSNGSTLTYTGPGTVVVEADQAAGAGYAAAVPVQVSIAATVLTVPVGTNSGPISTLMTFQAAGTPAVFRTSTQGAEQFEFALPSFGTCNVNAGVPGQTCVLQFSFTPAYPGQRFGGVTLSDASGNMLATAYFYGVGSGPQVTFSPATQTTLAGSVPQPAGVAIDGAGDVFVCGYGFGLYEIPAGQPQQTIGSFGSCDDVAVDGVGNVFVESNRTTLSEVLAVNGAIPASPTVVTISSQFDALNGIKVDGLGNVYLAKRLDQRDRCGDL